jgi:hypothetical protein
VQVRHHQQALAFEFVAGTAHQLGAAFIQVGDGEVEDLALRAAHAAGLEQEDRIEAGIGGGAQHQLRLDHHAGAAAQAARLPHQQVDEQQHHRRRHRLAA